MADPQKQQTRHGAAKSSWASLPFIAACSALVAGCVFFGSPNLWTANENPAPASDAADSTEEATPPLEATDVGSECIASYQAISQSTDNNRAENIRLASETINGIVIEPGETFSFNDTVGDTRNDERYLMAPIINGDEIVDGRGGGICQVSTALYIAALKADLDVVERHAHTLVADYAPVGLDATLSYGSLDLKIKNDTEYPVRIEAEALGQSVEVSLYGHPLSGNTTINATSKTTDRFEVAAGDNEELSEGTYYTVESYRVYYENGIKTQSVLLSTGTYKVGESEALSLGEGSVDPTK